MNIKANLKITFLLSSLFSASVNSGFSQTFADLDFENPNLVSDPNDLGFADFFYASCAIPGWAAYTDGNP